jgi:SAM-dependent methyltransferase
VPVRAGQESGSDPYDSLFYDSLCIPETHPERLAVLGRLLGVAAADPARARVLELGCAPGGNLIPMAAGLPGATLLGIDRSGAQVESGSRLIERLGLANVRLRQGDILDLDPGDPDLGPFDYILAHGVYSWVPPAVRERLPVLAGRLLAPGGICYVSWNVLPGWHLRQTLRDCLLDACRDAVLPAARLAAAKAALKRLAAALAGLPGEAARLLREELRRVGSAPDSYLYFEYLAEHNHPLPLRAFLGECASGGLRYLCDSRLHTLFPASLGEGVESALADLDDGLDLEQWLDFVGSRAFRQSLLVRADEPPEEGLSLDRFAQLAILADLTPPPPAALKGRRPATFRRGDGEGIEVIHPLTRAVLVRLAAAYPDALPLGSVFPAALGDLREAGAGQAAEGSDSALAELFGLFARGAVEARLAPRRVGRDLPERPRALPLVRALVESGSTLVPTREHENLGLDPLAVRLVACLDGSRDLSGLAACLAEGPATGRAGGRLGALLHRFWRCGVLEQPEPQA